MVHRITVKSYWDTLVESAPSYKIGSIIFYENKYYKVCADSSDSIIVACRDCQLQSKEYACIYGHCSKELRPDNTSIHYEYATKQEAFKAFMLGELICL